MATKRKNPIEAKRAILAVAHRYLVEGGPDAVKVQRIADEMGITDAAIHYHFKNREALLIALLQDAGRALRRSVNSSSSKTPAQLLKDLEQVYNTEGYARLAMWLSLHGWSDSDKGMFDDLVDNWTAENPDIPRREIQFSIALLNLVAAAQPLFGGAFLRSVGLDDDDLNQRRFTKWILETLSRAMF